MIPIVTPAEMRAVDAAAPEPVDELIRRAAWQVARTARSMMGGVYGRRVVAIAGPGNNGADARVAAQVLRRWGVHVQVVAPDYPEIGPVDLVIDGAFGTGMNRDYHPPAVAAATPVLAVDIPSGVDGLTGVVRGVPLHADRTITFAALKPGLLIGSGRALAGDVEVADIGLDVSAAQAWMITANDVRDQLPRRHADAHKWKRSVYVVGGSAGMYGAPLLASTAALRSGSGMVWCGLPGQPPPTLGSEVVFRALPAAGWASQVLADSQRFGALVIGCGMPAQSDASAHTEVRTATAGSSVPVVVDGGGIRALGRLPELAKHVVLTPHDAEFESLVGERPGPDRFQAARHAAAVTGATVLLKGPTTIVASPDGTCLAASAGDQRLATAGTGDVLAGVIGSLLAGGMEPRFAAAAGAWLHGTAAQASCAHGFVASDLFVGLQHTIGQLLGPSFSLDSRTHQ